MRKFISLLAAILMTGSMLAGTVYFVNDKGWSDPHCYAWSPQKNAAWPGEAMTKENYQLRSHDVYSYTAAEGASYGKCIFNGGGKQTADLDWNEGKYFLDGAWYTRAELENQTSTDTMQVTPPDTTNLPAVTYYMKHAWDGSNWSWKVLEDSTLNYMGLPLKGCYVNNNWYGVGVNVNTEMNDATAKWFPASKIQFITTDLETEQYIAAPEPEVGTWATFIYSSLPKDTVLVWYAPQTPVDTTIVNPTDSTIVNPTDSTIVNPVDTTTTINYYLIGGFNSWNMATAVAMPHDEIVMTWAAGTYSFKVITPAIVDGTDVNWTSALGYADISSECSSEGIEADGTNVKVTLTDAGAVTVKVVDGQLCVTGSFGEAVIASYTIAGESALLGVNWDPAAAANDMTETAGVWTLKKENVSLTAQEYQYKVVANHAWGVSDYPAMGNNLLTIAEAGTYNVTFTWKPAVPELTAEAVPATPVDTTIVNPTDSTIVNPTDSTINYYLIGGFNSWNMATAVAMPHDEIVMTWAAGTYSFKVITPAIVDGTDVNWTSALGYADISSECSSEGIEADGTNVKVTLTDAGAVTVKVVDGQLCVTGNFGEAVIASYTIAGESALLGVNWDPAAAANDMTETAGVWTLKKENVSLTAQEYQYKVVANHAWGVSDYPAMGNNLLTIAEAGTYNVTFTWKPAVPELTAEAVPATPVEPTNLENLYLSGKVIKTIENGQIVIIKGGIRYNILGM